MQRLNMAAGAVMCVLAILTGAAGCAATQHHSLPSWNDGAAKSAVGLHIAQAMAKGHKG